MTIRVGLTGSIGMGKSTTAQMFLALGVPVWDADRVVADLYATGGPAGPALAELDPRFMAPDGSVDRAALKAAITADPSVLRRIEGVVHPQVAQNRAEFIQRAQEDGIPLVVLDIPLLFETGAERAMDHVLVVSAPAAEQRRRVLSRPGMTPDIFDRLLAAQMPDAEKRARADSVIETHDLDSTRQAVKDIVDRLTRGS